MTIHLPNDLETSIQAVVQSGRFASIDDAMAEAARLLLRRGNPVTVHHSCPKRRTDTGFPQLTPDFPVKDELTPDFPGFPPRTRRWPRSRPASATTRP